MWVEDKDIRIYVVNRIDMESQKVDNDLFIPIRCGAVLDKRQDIDMLGDDTGDNISEKRESYCELTVMYWIWKNVKADYVGLMHYRRIFSFREKDDVPILTLNIGGLDNMSRTNLEYIGLLDKEKVADTIRQYDFISAHPYDVKKYGLGHPDTAMQGWLDNVPEYISKENFNLLFSEINRRFPEIYQTAITVRDGRKFLGFNCCIARKELFDNLCEFVFDILFSIEQKLKKDEKNFSEQNNRVLGYMGEWLYTIWVFHMKATSSCKFGEQQLVTFGDTSPAVQLHAIQDALPIVFPVTLSNFPVVSTSIQSIVENTDAKLDFILLEESILNESNEKYIMDEMKSTLEAHFELYENVSIRFYNPKDSIGILERHAFFTHSHKEHHWLLCLPWILREYARVLFLAPTIVAQEDIAKLFEVDLDGKAIGAVRDIYFLGTELRSPNENRIGQYTFMRNPWNFCSTDVVLMQLDTLRSRMDFDSISDVIDSRYDSWFVSRNFNAVYEKYIQFLDFRWNYCAVHDIFFKGMIRDNIPQNIKYQFNIVKKPALLNWHVGGSSIPFRESAVISIFCKYMRNTPFYEVYLMRRCEEIVNRCADIVRSGLSNQEIYARFIFPWKSVKPGARIVLYGGGIVGKTFLKQLSNNPYCHVVAVCDRKPEQTGIQEAPVICLRELANVDEDWYDLVLIAIEREDIAIEIRKDLELIGIPPQKIKWVDPAKK